MRVIGCLATLGLLVPVVADATEGLALDHQAIEQMSLEQLLAVEVVTVSKHAQSLAEAPATITVITREDFARHGWLSIGDALWAIPGLHLSDGRDYLSLGVRGISPPLDVNSRVLVLLDGHTMNNPWSSAGYLDELLALPVEAIEQVEVIRGPSSSMYGSNAFLAVVNIRSRQATADAPGSARSSLGWSSLAEYRAAQTYHHRFAQGITVGLHALAAGGPGPELRFDDMTRPRLNRPQPTPTDGLASGADYQRGYNLGASVSWAGVTLLSYWSDRLQGLPTARDDAIFNDPYNSVQDSRGFLEARYELELGEHRLLARAFYDRYRHRQYLHRDPSDWEAGRWYSDDPHSVSEGNTDSVGAELQGMLQLWDADSLVLGTEVQWHQASQPSYELDLVSGAPIPDSLRGGIRNAAGEIDPIAYWNAALYLQNTLTPLEQLSLVAGLRYDYHSLFTSFGAAESALAGLSPRAALVYVPLPELSVKLMYGEAFRNPSLFEAFFDDGAAVCGNPEVRPERVRTLELASLWSSTRGVSASASLYLTSAVDLLEKQPVASCYQDSGPRQRFANQGAITVVGTESSLQLRGPAGVQLQGQFGVQWAERDALGKRTALANSPPIVVGAGLLAPLYQDKLHASARARWVAARYTWQLGAAPAEDPYLLIDAALTARDLLGGARASLNVSNALDVRYRDPVSSSETIATAVPQPGAAVHLRVGYDW